MMQYKKSTFTIENYSLDKVIKKFKTPVFCYSLKKLRKNINDFKSNFKSISPLICFSTKSNSNLEILKIIKKNGLGADVVSMGELMLALKAGIDSKKIVFSGVGKTTEELNYAINKKILLINCESMSEIFEIEKIAKLKKIRVDIGLRLNPNTDAKTIKQISTGKKENKFGVNEKTFIEICKIVKKSKYLNLKCLSVHIGSQILDYRPYEKMVSVLDKLINKTRINFEYVDLGGGIGIDYDHMKKNFDFKKYNKIIKKFKKKHKCKIIFEPGRSIIGNTAILLTKIIYIKENQGKNFIIVDAAMNDFMRPALYGAKHRIIPLKKNNIITSKTYDFVGPICETTDKFLTTTKFQKLKQKDYLIICDVGAYGSSLSSNYNIRPKPPEVMINNTQAILIKKRQNLKDLI